MLCEFKEAWRRHHLHNCMPGTAAKARQSRWASRYGPVGVRYAVNKNHIAEKKDPHRSVVLSLTTYEHARDWIIDAELPRRLAYFQRVRSAVHARTLLFRPENIMLLHVGEYDNLCRFEVFRLVGPSRRGTERRGYLRLDVVVSFTFQLCWEVQCKFPPAATQPEGTAGAAAD